ncbi:MAG: phosphatase PAP2 family protein [Burkholderiales bacterium]|nr:phosphatase PAP2 family protein [Burkholderiales bacterium]
MQFLKTGGFLLLMILAEGAFAGGGPLGIDHRLAYDNSGIFKRQIQQDLLTLMVMGEIGGALWEGDETRLGKTLWQSVDSTILASASAAALKTVFTRSRPTQTNDPNQFFRGSGNYSFPSGEVAAMSAIVTPLILEYREEDPWVYALEILPVYDMVARMKVQAHWQSDVLAGFAIGTFSGYFAHSRQKSFTLQVLPGGFSVGLKKEF